MWLVRPSLTQGTGAETNVLQRTTPLLALVSTCDRPLEALSWCHLGHAEPPYWGGGGGGGGAVKVIWTGTVTLPASAASNTNVAVREPAVVSAATETETLEVPPGTSDPEVTESVTLASLEVAFHDRFDPPSLSSES